MAAAAIPAEGFMNHLFFFIDRLEHALAFAATTSDAVKPEAQK
jgi:hypothetical protein